MSGVVNCGINDPVLWETWRVRIVADKERTGHLSCALILAAATRLNRSPRQIRRWLETEPDGVRKRYELDDEAMAFVRMSKGNRDLAWEKLVKHRGLAVSKKTFRRAYKRLSPGVRLGLEEGLRAMRSAQPWLRLVKATDRNQIWEIDHALLEEMVVRDSRTNHLGHPWVTVVIDVCTRMIIGFSVTLTKATRGNPTTESALAAIADAILGRDYDGMFVGGKPQQLRFDQGSDFMHPVADAVDRLGIAPVPVMKETPQHKPYIERFFGTLKVRYLPPLVGYGLRLDSAA